VRKQLLFFFFSLSVCPSLLAEQTKGPPQNIQTAPKIASFVKQSILKKVINDRDVFSHARLENYNGVEKRYAYDALMIVRGNLKTVRRIMTDYKLYSKMIPYISRTDFFPESQVLQIEGGIWKYRLISSVLFTEKSEAWIQYSIIKGHFEGLKGDMVFESAGEKGTLVYIRGEQMGSQWPPAFIIERGAEIVFGFTGRRMRSYIESYQESQIQGERSHDPKVPKPRHRF
jgi:hypothetical protein